MSWSKAHGEHKYYKLDCTFEDDMWALGEVTLQGGVEYALIHTAAMGRRSGVVELLRDGRKLDYSITAFGVPVVAAHLAEAIQRVATRDIDTVPVLVDGVGGWSLLVVRRIVDCLDVARSEVVNADPDDDYRFSAVYKMRVMHRSIPASAMVFRVADWLPGIVVRADVRASMERAGCRGASFSEV